MFKEDKINFNYEVSNNLYERQLNFGNYLNANVYEKKIIKSIFNSTKNLNLLMRDLRTNCYNFCFSPDGNYMAVDEAVWKVSENLFFCPCNKIMDVMQSPASANVFDKDSTKLFASCMVNRNYEKFYISVNDLIEQRVCKIISTDNFVQNITSCPSTSSLFSFCSEIGDLYLHDLRCTSTDKIKEENVRVNSLQYHPMKDYLLLVSTKNKNDCYLFDIRNRQKIFHYGSLFGNNDNYLYANFNKKGDQIFAIRKQHSPLLFYTSQSYPTFEFDETGFLIYFTNLKNCCFAGPNDEFVVTASDGGNVFMWEIPEKNNINEEDKTITTKVDSAKFVLKNLPCTQTVDYNYQKSLLACLGKYESIRFWSPFPFDSESDTQIRQSMEGRNIPFNNDIETQIFNETSFIISHLLVNGSKDYHKGYFINKNSNNINLKNIETDFKEDKNLILIKSFINNYGKDKEKRNNELLEELEKTFKNEMDLKKRLIEENYITLFIELYKVVQSKVFIKKSLIYIKNQLTNLKNLETDLNDSDEKFFEKMKLILKVMSNDIEIIYLRNQNLYKNIYNSIEKLIDIFRHSAYNMYSFFEKFKIQIDQIENKVFVDTPKMNYQNNKEKYENILKIFDEDLKRSLIDLINELKIKEEAKTKFEIYNFFSKFSISLF